MLLSCPISRALRYQPTDMDDIEELCRILRVGLDGAALSGCSIRSRHPAIAHRPRWPGVAGGWVEMTTQPFLGWICPRCRAVNAPGVLRCDCTPAKAAAPVVEIKEPPSRPGKANAERTWPFAPSFFDGSAGGARTE